jgi:hypothetical protein
MEPLKSELVTQGLLRTSEFTTRPVPQVGVGGSIMSDVILILAAAVIWVVGVVAVAVEAAGAVEVVAAVVEVDEVSAFLCFFG